MQHFVNRPGNNANVIESKQIILFVLFFPHTHKLFFFFFQMTAYRDRGVQAIEITKIQLFEMIDQFSSCRFTFFLFT